MVRAGYTKVPHAILEALGRFHLPPTQSKVLMIVLRKTLGWHKESDEIALSQFEQWTGIRRQNVYRALKGLEKRRIVISSGRTKTVKKYQINRDPSDWLPRERQAKFRPTGCTAESVINGGYRQSESAIANGYTPSSILITDLVRQLTTDPKHLLSVLRTSKESQKENGKEDLKENDGPLAFGEATDHARKDKAWDPEKEKAQKLLSKQRNLMAISKLYSDDELFGLGNKTLEELERIHTEKLALNPLRRV